MGSAVILRGQPTFYDKWFRRYWILPFKSLLALLGPERAFPAVWCGYIMWNTNRNLGSAVILRGQPTFYDKWFRIYWILPFWSLLALFGPKRALPVVLWVYIMWNTNRNLGSAVILRGQPTFYDKWFSRYWISPSKRWFFGLFSPLNDPLDPAVGRIKARKASKRVSRYPFLSLK